MGASTLGFQFGSRARFEVISRLSPLNVRWSASRGGLGARKLDPFQRKLLQKTCRRSQPAPAAKGHALRGPDWSRCKANRPEARVVWEPGPHHRCRALHSSSCPSAPPATADTVSRRYRRSRRNSEPKIFKMGVKRTYLKQGKRCLAVAVSISSLCEYS